MKRLELQQCKPCEPPAAWAAGHVAFVDGLPDRANPYRADTVEWADWNAGWHEAAAYAATDKAMTEAMKKPDFDPDDWK